jgi:hypothetical protein
MNHLKYLSTPAIFAIFILNPLLATLYEDAEDQATTGWEIYDNSPAGATITNIMDNQKNSRVIELKGAGRSNSYTLGARAGESAWNNSSEKTLHWSMNINEKYKLYISLDTTKGHRYLYYSHGSSDKGLISTKYIHYGLGAGSMDGNWHDYTRDLEADLKKYEPDNSILSVNGLRLQGSAKIDDIKLTGNGVPPPPPPPFPDNGGVIDSKVLTKSDTAEEFEGLVDFRSSDLELVQDKLQTQIVGLRFTNLNIPKNTNITKAYIQFVVDEKSTENTTLMLHGEKVPNANTFESKVNNISSRVKTSSSVSWSPSAWNIIGAKGMAQRTSDLKPLVQEIVNQAGWNEGNAMAFIIEGNGKRVAESYNGTGILAPVLHIEYGNENNLEDKVAPEITLNGNAVVTVVQNQAYHEQGAVATDDVDGAVTVTTTGSVNTAVLGSYTITYQASDESGNHATKERTVKVIAEPANNAMIHVPADYATLAEAVAQSNDGDTIILDPGTYSVLSVIKVTQNNLTIASKYHTTGDESYIDSTIVEGDDSKNSEMFDSVKNLKMIGLTARNAGKFVIFNDGYENLVDHCKIKNIHRDGVSFDYTSGGKVTYCTIEYAGDDSIDVDSKVRGDFEFAYNHLLHSHDDGIEIHLWKDKRNNIVNTMHYNIHDNIIEASNKDGIQLIDYFDTTNRVFTISNNTFKNNGHVGVGAIFEKTNHALTNFVGTGMAESVKILNNTFDTNMYHILGGDNMEVKGNSFKNASQVAIKRVKGSSVIENNTFSNNAIDRLDSN